MFDLHSLAFVLPFCAEHVLEIQYCSTSAHFNLTSRYGCVGYPTYLVPNAAQRGCVNDFWAEACMCYLTELCTCGQSQRTLPLVPASTWPSCQVQGSNILHLKTGQWLCGGVIDEFMRLLNVRQRGIENSQQRARRCLYFDTLYSQVISPPQSSTPSADASRMLQDMLAPARLLGNTASPRCCLAQDVIIMVLNLNSNHWVTIKLDMTDCSIMCFDSLRRYAVSQKIC